MSNVSVYTDIQSNAFSQKYSTIYKKSNDLLSPIFKLKKLNTQINNKLKTKDNIYNNPFVLDNSNQLTKSNKSDNCIYSYNDSILNISNIQYKEDGNIKQIKLTNNEFNKLNILNDNEQILNNKKLNYKLSLNLLKKKTVISSLANANINNNYTKIKSNKLTYADIKKNNNYIHIPQTIYNNKSTEFVKKNKINLNLNNPKETDTVNINLDCINDKNLYYYKELINNSFCKDFKNNNNSNINININVNSLNNVTKNKIVFNNNLEVNRKRSCSNYLIKPDAFDGNIHIYKKLDALNEKLYIKKNSLDLSNFFSKDIKNNNEFDFNYNKDFNELNDSKNLKFNNCLEYNNSSTIKNNKILDSNSKSIRSNSFNKKEININKTYHLLKNNKFISNNKKYYTQEFNYCKSNKTSSRIKDNVNIDDYKYLNNNQLVVFEEFNYRYSACCKKQEYCKNCLIF